MVGRKDITATGGRVRPARARRCVLLFAHHRRLEGPRVQDADRIADVEMLAKPTGARRLRVEVNSCVLVALSQRFDGIVGDK